MVAIVLGIAIRAQAQGPYIAYILPDIGSPAMNTYVEIYASYGSTNSFGTDGIYTNNPGDAVQVVCSNSNDIYKIAIGPVVVSSNGQLISTQIFVMPAVAPNSTNWQRLASQFRIPIKVLVNNIPSNADTFYCVAPQNFGVKNATGIIGSGTTWGMRSRRGAMIVDSMILTGAGVYKIDTSDCDPSTSRNDGYLPLTIISKGKLSVSSVSSIDISAPGNNGAPGGGGGGHGKWAPCSSVPLGVGIRGPNSQGYSKGGGEYYRDPLYCDPVRYSLNDAPGGSCGIFDSSGGGGTGFPFSSGGSGPTFDFSQCQTTAVGVSGGNGGSHDPVRGGGGGGFATPGDGASGCPTSNGGLQVGNMHLVPIGGGSGGGGGNGAYCNGSGTGGGGGGAFALWGMIQADVNEMDAQGGVGETGLWIGTNGENSSGGGGAGGGLIVGGKLSVSGNLSMKVGGGQGGAAPGAGGNGGSGRVRYDGPIGAAPIVSPVTASVYRGLSTDTSHVPVSPVTLTGTGNGQPIRLYRKSESTTWTLIATITGYGTAWTQSVVLPGADSIYMIVAAQQMPSPITALYTSEPPWVMSQAAANLYWTQSPNIVTRDSARFRTLICPPSVLDTEWVYNTGNVSLAVSYPPAFTGPDAAAFTLVSPTTAKTIPPGDSAKFILQLASIVVGSKTATLVLTTNDNLHPGHNPYSLPLKGRVEKAAFTLTDTVKFFNIHAGASRDSILIFKATGTVPDTVFLVQRGSGATWMSFAEPLPRVVLPSPPNDTAHLHVHVAAPHDTGMFYSSFYLAIKPCAFDTMFTLQTYVISGRVDVRDSIFSGTSICGGDACDTFSVRNSGNAPLTITGFHISGADSLQFTTQPSAFPKTLAAKSSATFGVCFNPLPGTGYTRTAQIEILSDDSVSLALPAIVKVVGMKDSSGLFVSSALLDVGSVCVNHEECAEDTLFVVGPATDTITNIFPYSGSTAFHLKPTTLPFVLGGGTKFPVQFCFDPLDIGPSQSTFAIVSQPCNDTTLVTVKGKGFEFKLVAFDSIVSFGVVKVGTTARAIATYIVTGDVPLTVDSLNFLVSFPVPAEVFADSIRPKLPAVLNPGDTLRMYLHFTPYQDGNTTGVIHAVLSGACDPAINVQVIGVGASSSLLIAKNIVPFGNFVCGTATRDDSVVVTNTGATSLNVSCAIAGTDAASFALLTAPSFVLNAGAASTVRVSCVAGPVGPRNALLVVSSDDSKHPRDSVKLTATMDTAALSVSLTDVDFGSLSSCQPMRDSILILTNTGTVTDTVDAQGTTANFSVITGMPRIIPPGKSDTLTIRFAPAVKGVVLTDVLHVRSNPCSLSFDINEQGRSDTSTFTPSAFDVGSALVGSAIDTIVVFKNTGVTPACVSGVNAVPPQNFKVTANVPKTLATNDTLQLHVHFTPTNTGASPGFVDLQLTCPCNGATRITLSGTGLPNAPLIGRAAITLPAVHAAPGMPLVVPIAITSSQAIIQSGATQFTARVSYNRSLLIPDGAMSVTLGGGSIDTITLTNAPTDTLGTIGALKFIAALGDSSQTTLHFESFSWNKGQIVTSLQDGLFQLDSICQQGGPRLFNAKGQVTLAQNRPNPFSDKTEIAYEVIEAARTKLYLVDFLGRTAATLVDADLPPGKYSATLTAGMLHSGAYALVLQTQTQRLYKIVEIAR